MKWTKENKRLKYQTDPEYRRKTLDYQKARIDAKKAEGLWKAYPYNPKYGQARMKKYHTDEEFRLKTIDAVRNSTQKRTLWFVEYKESLGCKNCGESNADCLDFHHKDPSTKKYAVTKNFVAQQNKEIVMEELLKCEILCSNCHRKLHAKEWRELRISGKKRPIKFVNLETEVITL